MDTDIKLEVKTSTRLRALGLKQAADRLDVLAPRKRKMAIAYELYRFVRPEKINEFQATLRKKTETKIDKYSTAYKTLKIMPLEHYEDVPPDTVLVNLEKAQSLKVAGESVFDSFEIAFVANAVDVKMPDPILFGRIKGCEDRFFIDQWDDDVKIDDILKPNEG